FEYKFDIVAVAKRALDALGFPPEPAMERRKLIPRQFRPATADHIENDPYEIFAAEKVVAGAGPHFHQSFEAFENRNVEGAAAQVEYQKGAFCRSLLQTVGKSRRRRLIDQAAYGQPRQFS